MPLCPVANSMPSFGVCRGPGMPQSAIHAAPDAKKIFISATSGAVVPFSCCALHKTYENGTPATRCRVLDDEVLP
jgi:hypothetical protein